MLPDSDFCS